MDEKSSIIELQYVIRTLTSWDGDSQLEYAGRDADSISHHFNDVNGSLSGGWDQVSDFMLTIGKTVRERLNVFYEYTKNYVDLTKDNMAQEHDSVTKSNDAVESIIDEMGI